MKKNCHLICYIPSKRGNTEQIHTKRTCREIQYCQFYSLVSDPLASRYTKFKLYYCDFDLQVAYKHNKPTIKQASFFFIVATAEIFHLQVRCFLFSLASRFLLYGLYWSLQFTNKRICTPQLFINTLLQIINLLHES